MIISKRGPALIMFALAATIPGDIRASVPPTEQLKNREIHEQKLKARHEKDLPWEQMLERTFMGEAQASTDAIFLTTYKHQTHESGNPSEPAAKSFPKAWKKVKFESIASGLEPLQVAEVEEEIMDDEVAGLEYRP